MQIRRSPTYKSKLRGRMAAAYSLTSSEAKRIAEKNERYYDRNVAPLVQAYNSIRNDATWYTPHYLMFGWHPKLAIDIFFGMDPHTENADKRDHPTYISKLRDRMAAAYSLASSEPRRISERISGTMTVKLDLHNLKLVIEYWPGKWAYRVSINWLISGIRKCTLFKVNPILRLFSK